LYFYKCIIGVDCDIIWQFQHLELRQSYYVSLFTPFSHLNLGLPTGQLRVNSASRPIFGFPVKGSLCTCPAHCNLLNLSLHASLSMKFTHHVCLWLLYFAILCLCCSFDFLHVPFPSSVASVMGRRECF